MRKQRPTHVGEVIKARRETAGLTRNALAVKAGVNASYLMRLERGNIAHPSFHTVCQLADALGCKADELRP